MQYAFTVYILLFIDGAIAKKQSINEYLLCGAALSSDKCNYLFIL